MASIVQTLTQKLFFYILAASTARRGQTRSARCRVWLTFLYRRLSLSVNRLGPGRPNSGTLQVYVSFHSVREHVSVWLRNVQVYTLTCNNSVQSKPRWTSIRSIWKNVTKPIDHKPPKDFRDDRHMTGKRCINWTLRESLLPFSSG